jgi:hypothetical protein
VSPAQPQTELLTRAAIRRLKKLVASGCAEAAEQLLVDSIRKGHERLTLHRYAMLHRLDAQRCAPLEPYCRTVAARMSVVELRRIFEHVDRSPVLPHGVGAPG